MIGKLQESGSAGEGEQRLGFHHQEQEGHLTKFYFMQLDYQTHKRWFIGRC